jgi:4-amino-4-deoxy-L-arabinose transferase-like glycosyltransferase
VSTLHEVAPNRPGARPTLWRRLTPWNSAESAVLSITLLAFTLRLLRLDFQPLWWDEGYSVYFASQDLASLTLMTAADIHPPFYYYVLHYWIALFGPSGAALRLLSVVIGAATIPVFYVVARRLVPGGTALLACLLLAVSPFHVYYSQEVRMYALATLLGLASIYFAQRLLMNGASEAGPPSVREQNGRRTLDWFCYVLFTALAMYTLYYAAFIPLFQTLYALLANRRNRRRLLEWLAAQVALAILYLPWIGLAGGILVNYVGDKMAVEARVPLSLPTYLTDHFTAFAVGQPLGIWGQPQGIWSPLTWGSLALLTLAAAGVAANRSLRARAEWLLSWLVIPPAAGFVLNLVYPFAPSGYQRFLLFCLPAYLLAAAAGLTALGPPATTMARRVALPVTGVLLLGFTILPLYAFYTTPRYPSDDYRPLIAQIAALGQPDDAILTVFPWQVGYLESYYPQPRPRIVEAPDAMWSRDPQRLRQDLDALTAASARLWFPAHQKHGAILEQQVEAYLSEGAYPIANDWFGDTRLYFFTAGRTAAPSSQALSFDRRVDLLAWAIGDEPVEAGRGVLPVDLRWRLTAPITSDYIVKLRLADSRGSTWGQRDSSPVAGRLPFSAWQADQEITDRHGLLIPAGTPPGAYQVRLSLYARATGESLSVQDASGRTLGSEAVLGAVQVTPSTYQAPLAALQMERSLFEDFAGELRLVGSAGGAGLYRPGDTVALSLFWQARTKPARAYIVFVQLQDAAGKPWALTETPDLGNGYTLDQLTPGQSVRAQYSLLIPATAPDGSYRLVAGLLDPTTKQRVPASQGDQVNLIKLALKGREHTTVTPPMQQAVNARLGDVADLLGFDLSAPATGRTVNITLYWRSRQETSTAYKVFVHLLDARQTIWGQRDAEPQNGDAPTTSWIPGEIISDTYSIPVQPGAPPGEYDIEIGMYSLPSGARLWLTNATGQSIGDHLILGRVAIAQ